MKQYSHKDMRTFLNSLSVLYADPDLFSLPARIIETIKQLVSVEILALDKFDLSSLQVTAGWAEPCDSVSPENYEIFQHYAHMHPRPPLLFCNRISTVNLSGLRQSFRRRKDCYFGWRVAIQLAGGVLRELAPGSAFVSAGISGTFGVLAFVAVVMGRHASEGGETMKEATRREAVEKIAAGGARFALARVASGEIRGQATGPALAARAFRGRQLSSSITLLPLRPSASLL